MTTICLPDILLPVGRGRALAKGLLRLAAATAVTGVTLAVAREPNWRLLWLDQWMSLLALAAILSVAAGIAVWLVFSSVRWMLFAGWPGVLQIRITPDWVSMRLGPFGEHVFDWARVRPEVEGGVDPDLACELAAEVISVRLIHAPNGQDVTGMLLRFSRLDSDALRRRLEPYVGWLLEGDRSDAVFHPS